MKTVGYLEGTDPEFLTKLVCMGYRTLPIGNDTDNHGKNIAFISIADKVDLIVGYLHKVSPAPDCDQITERFLNTRDNSSHTNFTLSPKRNITTCKENSI